MNDVWHFFKKKFSTQVPGRNSLLSDDVDDDMDGLDVPSANEFLWTSTMSYCNVYRVTYKMFVAAGIPVKASVISNDLMATVLIPDDFDDSPDLEPGVGPTVEFLRFRKASQLVEDFVFKIDPFGSPATADDVDTGLAVWDSIETATIDFMNGVSGLTDGVEQAMIDLTNQPNVDPMSMMYLYRDTCDRMIQIMSNGTLVFNRAFSFIANLNPSFHAKFNQVSVIFI